MKSLIVAALLAVPTAVAGTLTFNYTGVLQQYVIPTDGNYFIVSAGAQGGSGQGGSGGAGTEIEGNAFLTAGTVLDIIVGQSGFTGDFGTIWGGGGGGGSFVWIDGSPTPLIIGGGGGGAGYDGAGGVGAATYSTTGEKGSGPGGGAGGTNGQGGQGGTGDGCNYNGGGGAGWLGNGGNGCGTAPGTGTGSAGNGGMGPLTFLGGMGGCDDCTNGPFANGGFGGGGGGGWQGGGGGGGYSGGGGGDGVDYPGGAAGSYLDGSLSGVAFVSGGNQADGFVLISDRAIALGTPEPGSFGLAFAALIGFCSLKFARSRRA